MPTLLNTVIIEHTLDPRNIVPMPQKKQQIQTKPPYRLFLLVRRINSDTFDDTPEGQSWARGYWTENVSEEDFLFLEDKDIDWAAKQSDEEWEQWIKQNDEVNKRLVSSIGLDPDTYFVFGTSSTGFKPTDNLYEIKQ